MLLPGNNCIHQLDLAIAITGTPTESELFAHATLIYLLKIQGLKNNQVPTLEEFFRHAPLLLRDVLGFILVFSTDDLIQVDAAIRLMY